MALTLVSHTPAIGVPGVEKRGSTYCDSAASESFRPHIGAAAWTSASRRGEFDRGTSAIGSTVCCAT